MTHKNSILTSHAKFISMILMILLINACASGVSNNVKVTEDDMAKFNVMTPEEAISSLEKSLQQGKDNKLPLYTPSYFTEAEALLKKAQESLTKKKKKEEIIHDIAKADRLLAKANIKKQEVETELKELFAVNENLIKLEAPTVFKKEYEDIHKDFNSLIVKIETNKADKIEKDKTKLLKKFAALEVKAIKYSALHEADEIKTQAKAKDALKLAPKTYAEAVNAYQKSEADIAQNPHDEAKVNEAKNQALFAAKHALYVTERIPKLQQDFKKLPEAIVIAEEKRIHQISNAINNSDHRDKPIADQIDLIVSSIKTLNSENQDNAKNIETIANLETQLKEKDETLKTVNAELDKTKSDLTDRNNQMIKMTADLIHLQNIEKELKAQIAQLSIVPNPDEDKEAETESANNDTEEAAASDSPKTSEATESKTESTDDKPIILEDKKSEAASTE